MIPTRIWAVASLIAVLGCGDKPAKPADISTVMPNLPLPPSPTVVSKTGDATTLMVTVSSPAKIDQVEAYYRTVLSGPGWKLLKHSTDQSGAIVMLAEQKGPPLWVRIRSRPDSGGTLVDLAGAVADAAPAKRAS